ncbi:hypothetical protein HZS_4574 [Henneguya salminicola]|nr:hypothetical protein HZS_4574 [Henneguya salminicola]
MFWSIKSIFNDDAFSGRKNNRGERYHKRLTENFANAHPNLTEFVEKERNTKKGKNDRESGMNTIKIQKNAILIIVKLKIIYILRI